jgi:hypothetical protein
MLKPERANESLALAKDFAEEKLGWEEKLMAEKPIHSSDRSTGSRKFLGRCGLLCTRTKSERSGWRTDGHTSED